MQPLEYMGWYHLREIGFSDGEKFDQLEIIRLLSNFLHINLTSLEQETMDDRQTQTKKYF